MRSRRASFPLPVILAGLPLTSTECSSTNWSLMRSLRKFDSTRLQLHLAVDVALCDSDRLDRIRAARPHAAARRVPPPGYTASTPDSAITWPFSRLCPWIFLLSTCCDRYPPTPWLGIAIPHPFSQFRESGLGNRRISNHGDPVIPPGLQGFRDRDSDVTPRGTTSSRCCIEAAFYCLGLGLRLGLHFSVLILASRSNGRTIFCPIVLPPSEWIQRLIERWIII